MLSKPGAYSFWVLSMKKFRVMRGKLRLRAALLTSHRVRAGRVGYLTSGNPINYDNESHRSTPIPNLRITHLSTVREDGEQNGCYRSVAWSIPSQ